MKIKEDFFLVSNNCTVGYIYKSNAIKYDSPFNFGGMKPRQFVEAILQWDSLQWKDIDVVKSRKKEWFKIWGVRFDLKRAFEKFFLIKIPFSKGGYVQWFFPHHNEEQFNRVLGRFERFEDTRRNKKPFFVLVDDHSLPLNERLTDEDVRLVSSLDNVLIIRADEYVYKTAEDCSKIVTGILLDRGILSNVSEQSSKLL